MACLEIMDFKDLFTNSSIKYLLTSTLFAPYIEYYCIVYFILLHLSFFPFICLYQFYSERMRAGMLSYAFSISSTVPNTTWKAMDSRLMHEQVSECMCDAHARGTVTGT